MDASLNSPTTGQQATRPTSKTANATAENNPAVQSPKDSTRANGLQNVIVGALWCIGGIVVTAVTYEAATSNPEGGHYFVAWGAIIFGGLQCLKGFYQLMMD